MKLPLDPASLSLSVLALVGAVLVWSLCRRVVRLGFFALSLALGFGLAWGLSVALQRPQPLPILLGEAIAFAWAWGMIRRKAARIVGAVALLLAIKAATTFGPSALGFSPKPASLPLTGGVHAPPAGARRL